MGCCWEQRQAQRWTEGSSLKEQPIKELNQAPKKKKKERDLQTNFTLKVMFNLNQALPKGKRLVSSLGS